MTKLVLLGGPTGVGKSTVLRELEGRIGKSALLDADDVWRASPSLGVSANRHLAIQNVVSVMRGYFEAGCEIALVSWVFARSELYQPVIDGLEDRADSIQMLYLVADPKSIASRLRKREESEKLEYALSRLTLIESLPFAKLDTTPLAPVQVADWICGEVQGNA
jgi:predicted ABC-type ATPase